MFYYIDQLYTSSLSIELDKTEFESLDWLGLTLGNVNGGGLFWLLFFFGFVRPYF